NPRTLGPTVPRRFLQALSDGVRSAGFSPLSGGSDGASTNGLKAARRKVGGSGRLELARQVTGPASNPFITRLIVNRVWHHLFGRGIVESVDNFGLLGKPPSHPELLDYLATSFADDGWSIKRLVRRIALSSTYRMASSAGFSPSSGGSDS